MNILFHLNCRKWNSVHHFFKWSIISLLLPIHLLSFHLCQPLWVILIYVQKIVWLDFDTAEHVSHSALYDNNTALGWRINSIQSLVFHSLILEWRWKTGISDLKMLLNTLQQCNRHCAFYFDCNQRWLCLPWNMVHMHLWYKTENIHVYVYLLDIEAIVLRGDSRTICGSSGSGCI